MRSSLPSLPGAVDRVLDDHADALYDLALVVTGEPSAAVDVVREAIPLAIAEHGPRVTRSTLLGYVFGSALERTGAPGGLPAALLEAGEGTHEELQRVCREAVRVLEPRHRGILELTLRQGLHGEQLGEALGVSPGQTSAATKSAFQAAEHVVGAVLLARVARADCPELAAVLAALPASQDGALVAETVVDHQSSCPACDDRRRALVPVASLLAGIPAAPAPAELRRGTRPRTRAAASGEPRRVSPTRQRSALALGVVALIVLAASSTTALLRRDDDRRPAPPAPGPPGLTASVTELDFRKDGNETTFEVANPGADPLPYRLETDAPWLSVSAPTGTLPPGGRTTLVVTLDRSRAPEGLIMTELRATRPAGLAPVGVRAEVDRAPSVSKAEITPESLTASSCPGSMPAQARVSIVEESGIDLARLHWREPGGTERYTPLTRTEDGTFTGPVGPAPSPGVLTWWVVAVDSRGNTTVSAASELSVAGC